MRQIDADALKKEFCKDIMGGLNWERIIDNAPTIEERVDPNDIYYLCDHKRCGENFNCYACNHTTDIKHAVNFELVEFPRSAFFERARPHGKWNEILEPFGWDDIKSAQCSACGESYPYPTDCGFDDIVEMFKYCPECGAKMEAGTRWKEEEDQP